jgi:hypothetical protein
MTHVVAKGGKAHVRALARAFSPVFLLWLHGRAKSRVLRSVGEGGTQTRGGDAEIKAH